MPASSARARRTACSPGGQTREAEELKGLCLRQRGGTSVSEALLRLGPEASLKAQGEEGGAPVQVEEGVLIGGRSADVVVRHGGRLLVVMYDSAGFHGIERRGGDRAADRAFVDHGARVVRVREEGCADYESPARFVVVPEGRSFRLLDHPSRDRCIEDVLRALGLCCPVSRIDWDAAETRARRLTRLSTSAASLVGEMVRCMLSRRDEDSERAERSLKGYRKRGSLREKEVRVLAAVEEIARPERTVFRRWLRDLDE